MEKTVGAIILAAGKGTRMQSPDANKVTFLLNKKPLISHILDVLENMHIDTTVVVVGHARESVVGVVKNTNVVFAQQEEQLGTGHATAVGLEKLPPYIDDVFVMHGDDSFSYNEELLQKLATKHFSSDAAVTLLTIQVKNPQGLGRIVRDTSGVVTAIVEEKDATEEQRMITEINPACYMFHVDFLRKYLPQINKSSVTGEYYLTSLIDIAIKHNEKLETVNVGFIPWRGINTREELSDAEKMFTE